MEDSELRAAFHAAYDAAIGPAPWLGSSIREGMRRHTTTPASGPWAETFRRPWILAATAMILIAAVAVGVIAVSRALQQPPVPAAPRWTPCGPINGIPNIANAPGNPSPLPGAIPPGMNHECGIYIGSTQTPAALAAFFKDALTNAGWTVNTDGPIQGFVVTTWTPDPKATGGPQPGYRPAFTGLTGDDVASADAAIDSSGTGWVVNVHLTPRGTALFADLTRANVAACPGDASTSQTATCPQRFLAMWVRLTQDDVDHWDDSAYANGVSAPFDGGFGPQNTYPTLIEDAITLEAITGGEFQIAAGSRLDADYIAEGFNTRLFGSHVQLTFTKGRSFGVIDLVPAGKVTAIWVRTVS